MIGLWIFPFALIVIGSPVAFGMNALFNRAVGLFPSTTADEVRPEEITADDDAEGAAPEEDARR